MADDRLTTASPEKSAWLRVTPQPARKRKPRPPQLPAGPPPARELCGLDPASPAAAHALRRKLRLTPEERDYEQDIGF